MPTKKPTKKVVKKPKKKVTQKQKQSQKQVVNITIGSKRGRPTRKRGNPRQSANPVAQQGRVLEQYVNQAGMIPSNMINPTIIPAPFGEPLVTNPSTLSFATNAQPSIYRNMRREAPTSSLVNKSFAWSGASGSITNAGAIPPQLTANQASRVSAAKAVARDSSRKIKKTISRNEEAERAMMAVADADAFMSQNRMGGLNFGFRTPATSAVVEPSSQPSNDPFPSASAQTQRSGSNIMEGRSLFK
jgi:hypothetical protein